MALKERFSSSAETSSCEERYVSWEEVVVSLDKGRREVRYFLRKKGGGSDLALIGKEKSPRHMSYHYAIRDSSLGPFLKLKSRRQVVDWLDSIVSDSSSGEATMVVGKFGYEHEIGTLKDNNMQKLRNCTQEFSWVGLPWTCRKRRNHYQSFKRNGFQISANDFVFVLAEENKRLVAYLEDLYEDSRGNKMVVVRWFHRIDEVGIVLPHSFSDREVLFSLFLQDLSIECIDGLTSVLSPQHFATYRNEVCHTCPEPFVCSKKFDNDDVKPFDITQIKGYWRQEILRPVCANSDSKSNGSSGQSEAGPEREENLQSSSGIRPMKRQRCTKIDGTDAVELVALESENLSNCKIVAKTSSGNNSLKLATIKESNEPASHYLAVGSKVEVLSQDSGIRGCWFRASVIKKSKVKVKVQYHDLQDAEDESKKVEEWILASRIVAPDDLGLRLPERTKIRPQSNKRGNSFVADVGYIVDAWWHDGWWEGIVIQKEVDARYHAKYNVYFPGEKTVSVFGPSNLRHSRDWTGNGWVKLRERADIVTSKLSLSSLKIKQDLCKSYKEKSNPAPMGEGIQSNQTDIYSGSSEKDKLIRKHEVVPDLLKDVLLSQLRWKSYRKRNQGGISPQKQKCSDRHRKLSPSLLESDDSDSFVIPASLKVDHDDYKYQGDPSIFSSSVVPSLTNMVMCR